MASLPDQLRGEGESLVIHSHLMQMLTFIRGGGVEFLPAVDPGGIRKKFLDRLLRENRLALKQRGMALEMCKAGRLLLFLRPSGQSYRIETYKKSQYSAIYDRNGDLETVVVIYSYKIRQLGQSGTRDRWVRMRITAETITYQESDDRPKFEAEDTGTPTPNTLGFMPCVEVLNPAPGSEELGQSDFEALRGQIEAHDDLTTAILDNLDFFLTSRDPSEVTDAIMGGSTNDREWSSVNGFRDEHPNPWKGGQRAKRRSRRLKKVVGNLEPGEEIGQLNINALPPGQIGYADNMERQIREALGGILERGLETATEARLVYGKVEVTAREKREALYTFGVCQILEMAILAEESVFLRSNGAIGIPMGSPDRTVHYRVAPVFVQTAKDIQDLSIVGRNLGEMGVDAKEVLKFVFPHKNEAEIDRMVGTSGIPFRFLNQTLMAFNQLASVVDPLSGQPLADPRTGLPLLYSLIPPLIEALNYGQQFDPTTLPDTSRVRAESGAYAAAAIRAYERLTGNRAIDSNDLVSGDDRPTDGHDGQFPTPGSTVADSPGSNPFTNFFNINRSPILNSVRNIRNRGSVRR
jgi:hypothetical protein